MRVETLHYEFVVVGGGLAGIAAALSAARRGLRTAILHDRPHLGGSAGREVGLPPDGAAGGENNRFARETGLMEELRLERLRRGLSGGLDAWESLLLEKTASQAHLALYLETAAVGVEVTRPPAAEPGPGRLGAIQALAARSGERLRFTAPLFADCTGSGMVAVMAGARFRDEPERREEHHESLAPEEPGPAAPSAAMRFLLRDAGRPVPLVLPDWARRGQHSGAPSLPGAAAGEWWLHWRGEPGAPADAVVARRELLALLYATLDRLKNAPDAAPAAAGLYLAAAGVPAGFTPARRVLGDYVLTQQDLLEPSDPEDAVAGGGAPIRGEPAASACGREPPGCRLHLPGVYAIPLRCLYSRDVPNLLLAGRHASATALAASSLAAPATAAQMGEAIGAAAWHCRARGCLPAALLENGGLSALQQDLLRHDHAIPGVRSNDARDLARAARVTESSAAEGHLEEPDGDLPLDVARALMLPLAGRVENVSLLLRAVRPASLGYALHAPDPAGRFLPGARLCGGSVELPAAPEREWIELPAPLADAEAGFHWLLLEPAPGLLLAASRESLPGVASFSRAAGWEPDPGPWKLDRPVRNPFSPWRRAPETPCFRTDAWVPAFYAGEQVVNQEARPHRGPNIWVSAPTDFATPEWLEFAWEEPVEAASVYLYFNTGLDGEPPAPDVGRGMVPECVRHYRLLARREEEWVLLAEECDNHQRFRVHRFPPIRTRCLRLEVCATGGDRRAQLYEVRIYGPG